ncbi:hypothetical protein RHMOL_Rhmol03G0190600 [Rhododendron molle]|uniref:Uncharacterized protein n=2 Tax=Rhododendron molle TaxID=49168 RepID=A0ACC0PHL0_RHOML|nr:hypothetical protein RHMOL_Rhmol03G0190600 [Rhododendron molle]KAI8564564.1 hypothetical protein RHMOL_Rhmol03G0190600 [Rhododendron molle]
MFAWFLLCRSATARTARRADSLVHRRHRAQVSLFGVPAGLVMNSVRSFGLLLLQSLSRLPLCSSSVGLLCALPINDHCNALPHGFSA